MTNHNVTLCLEAQKIVYTQPLVCADLRERDAAAIETSGFIEEARIASQNWLVLAPYFPGEIGQHLAENKLSYADAVGNCHLQVGDDRGWSGATRAH